VAGIELVASEELEPRRFRRSGVLVLGAVGFLLTGVALGYSLGPESHVIETMHAMQWNATRAQGSIAYGMAAYATLAASVVVVLVALVRSSSGRLPRRLGRTNGLAGRREKPVAEFVREAKAVEIGLRVAREGYDLLQHHYPRPMCIDLGDSLRDDLKLTEENIAALRAELLGRTDRRSMGAANVSEIETVRDLFELAEHSPMEAIDRASMRLRITDLPFPARPVVANIEFTPSTPVPDPDFLRRAHFNWLRRRDSDYKGLRSRATDEQGASHHAGPFRRANESARKAVIRADAERFAREAAANGAVESKPSGSIFIPPRTSSLRQPNDIGLRPGHGLYRHRQIDIDK